MKKYSGNRHNPHVNDVIKHESGKPDISLPLQPSLDLFNHSPDGFEWGYGGSGPAQLALAILFDFTEDESFSIEFHQKFKHDFVMNFRHEYWTLDGEVIQIWIDKMKSQG